MDSVGSWSKNSKGCGDGSACSPTSTIRGVCPSGWLMPSKSEWETLFTAVGGVSNAGKVLKSSSGWNNGGNGTDAFSFSMLPAGEMDLNGFSTGGYGTRFWSSTEDEDDNHYAYNINLSFSKDNVELNDNRKYLRLSVRCLKD